MPLTASTPTFPDRPVDGQIDKIDSRVDPVSRTVLVRAAFPNSEDLLRPGMSFFVKLPLPGPTLASVPELALQWQDGKSFVWRIRDGAAERVDVASRRRLNSKVLIEGDITPGDIVVVEGVQRLRPGRAVEISGSQNP
jgi:RND family efflux transporter MFP subunit